MMFIKNFASIKFFLTISFIIITHVFSTNCYSIEPEEILQDQKQEFRARTISKNIRCMVCQNQSIDESNAPLAQDLRILIRNKIKKGQDDDEIYKFLTERYGDFILLKPPFKLNTLALWFLPFVFLLLGVLIVILHNKRSKKL